ncbi:hypothetical protein CNBD1680 [Cryptococcus deneoformans B-3501A]|nr:hypothetical protein CNBD1680 [Cryptococcus neoformans var. neoformans B-3501A]EAL21473.1 hypothetical protein CNBD1680 [Cryptococcus neoformans var. neoformans B-3501A]
MLDTIFLSIWFIFFLASVASMSTLASVFRDYDRFTWGRLGTATIGLSWVMTFLLLGILLFEVTYTLINFGRSYTTWPTPAANTIVEESIDEQAVLQSVQTTPVGIAVSVLSGARPPMSVPMRGKGVDRV